MTFQAKRRLDFWLGGLLLLLLFPAVRLLGLLLRRDHSLERRRGCVVIKLVGTGSLFLAMPSMQAIRREFPRGAFYLVGSPAVIAFARSQCWFDAYWTIDDSNLWRLTVSTLRALWNMALHTDHVIDLEVHSRLSTLLGLLSMVRNRIGFVDEIVFWRRGFYTHMTYFNMHGPVYAFYDMLAHWFGIECIAVNDFHAEFRRSVLSETLPPGLALPRRYVAIGHACSDLGRERLLLPAEWKRILQPLLLIGSEIVLLGSAADAALADSIIAALGTGRNLCGQLSVAQSALVIARATQFFGIDSMLLHIARALKVPTSSVWGPTDPMTRLRPTTATETIAYARAPCSPCIHVSELPPCRGRRDCMEAAVDSLVVPQRGVAEGVQKVIGWDVDPDASQVRAVSVLYA